MRFGFRGFSHLISTGCTSSTDALGYALRTIRYGHASTDCCRRRGCAYCAADRARFSTDANYVHAVERCNRSAHPVLSHATATASSLRREPGSSCWKTARAAMERGAQNLRRDLRLRVHMRGIPSRAVGGVRRGTRARHSNGPEEARIEAGASRLCQLSRHFDGIKRPHRDPRGEARFGKRAAALPGSSLKSLIGHPQGACGAAGVAATLLAMRDGIAPPTINVDCPDPECDLDYITEGARPLAMEYAVANCIAFGSKNSALVLRRWDG